MRRILLRTLASLVLLVLAFIAFVYISSEIALRSTWHVDEPALSIPADADARARGEHVAITRGCTECHSADLGGHVVMEAPPIGRMSAPNLTRGRGGVVANFDARTWERAIRHGIRQDDRSLLFMPARDYSGLSDADTADLIAYLQGVPPVDRDSVPSYVGPVGRMLFALGKLPMVEARLIDQHAGHPARLEIAATADYGRYLAQTCTGCHGERMSGGPIPGTPPNFPKPPNLTPDATGLAAWTKADFYRVFREGKKRDGSALDPFMPWQSMSRFSDTELDALWAYLQSLPPRPLGQR